MPVFPSANYGPKLAQYSQKLLSNVDNLLARTKDVKLGLYRCTDKKNIKENVLKQKHEDSIRNMCQKYEKLAERIFSATWNVFSLILENYCPTMAATWTDYCIVYTQQSRSLGVYRAPQKTRTCWIAQNVKQRLLCCVWITPIKSNVSLYKGLLHGTKIFKSIRVLNSGVFRGA